LRLRANHQLFEGTFLRGGARAETLKEGTLARVIFFLEQAWSRPGEPPNEEVALKVLDIIPAAPGNENVS
jgi:hypothetical protein